MYSIILGEEEDEEEEDEEFQFVFNNLEEKAGLRGRDGGRACSVLDNCKREGEAHERRRGNEKREKRGEERIGIKLEEGWTRKERRHERKGVRREESQNYHHQQ